MDQVRCPICNKIGSPKLGGKCKICAKKFPPQKGPGFMQRDEYYPNYGTHQGSFYKENYGTDSDTYPIERGFNG